MIYITSPVTTFESKNYDLCIQTIKDHFKEDVLTTKGLYPSLSVWKKQHESIIDRCNKLVYFVNSVGTIGRGVYLEINHAMSKGMNVYLYDGRKGVIPHHPSFIHIIYDGTNYTEYAEISMDDKRTSATPLLKRGKTYPLGTLNCECDDDMPESADSPYGLEDEDGYYWNEVMSRND